VGDQNLTALDTDDVAALLDVSDRQVRNYVKDKGLPSFDDGRGRRFVWAEVLAWYVRFCAEKAGSRGSQEQAPEAAQKESFEAASTRKTIAEADLKELQLARERGQVVAIGDAQRMLANLAKAMQTKILSWPTKMAGRLVGLKEREQYRHVLDRESRQLCHDLSTINAKPAAPIAEVSE
jgi:excisionase family DNA binding protein